MNATGRQTVLTAVLDHFGVDKYNRLISEVAATVERGSFRFWQESLFSKLKDITNIPITTVSEYAEIFRDALPAIKEISREQFLAEPSRYYYTEPVHVPDEWIVQAWEQVKEFRKNVTYEYAREARKNGELDCLEASLRNLTSILPFSRCVEMYCSIRDMSPHREREFRPTFDRIFGARMSEFPDPFTDEQLIEMLGTRH